MKDLLEEELKEHSKSNRPLIKELIDKLCIELDVAAQDTLHNILRQISPIYNAALKETKHMLNLLTLSTTMVSLYTVIDNTLGYGKLPQTFQLVPLSLLQ